MSRLARTKAAGGAFPRGPTVTYRLQASGSFPRGGSLNSWPVREPSIPLGNGTLIALLSSAPFPASLELAAVRHGRGRVVGRGETRITSQGGFLRC